MCTLNAVKRLQNNISFLARAEVFSGSDDDSNLVLVGCCDGIPVLRETITTSMFTYSAVLLVSL
jgi:hypothetical protein